MYIATGSGRDSFIFLGPQERHGKYGKLIKNVHSEQKQTRINEFWDKADKREDKYTLPSGNREKENSATTRFKVQGAPSELDDKKWFSTTTSANGGVKNASYNSSSLARKTAQDITLSEPRIPKYSGHVPGLHNVVGASPHSSKFQERSYQSMDFGKSSSLDGFNNTVSLPSLSRSSTASSSNRQQPETSFRVSSSSRTFTRFVSPVRSSIQTHHSGSFAGHVPSSVSGFSNYELSTSMKY
ncbi:hypothetical protein NAEGRDRAFT_78928 [Naegleria gruberi]|uniref:Uncharacterized protein n=1 Tax=Naegleria gruberi TaxID=5762 RepID=D2V7R5_NAEGR|nr:uncharacterized protein NAEGRDRAFT_78928 [Naegleria gruberi]EFC46918.1 hypothetical protein NAEGRDRAFT_78928 [Naegleria gruberi]|eukprot:XP_002679662.1 hypothetical protein NAEGRDRAFT_78928 [Naegleria gruberi strain NEG-M]